MAGSPGVARPWQQRDPIGRSRRAGGCDPAQEAHLARPHGELPGPDGARALARADHWEDLRRLHLSRSGIGYREAGSLAEASWFGRLEWLALDKNLVGPAGVRAIAARIGALKYLRLRKAEVGDPGVKSLAEIGDCESLIELSLQGNEIGNDGIRAFAGSGNFPTLRLLDLSDNLIGDEGARALARSPILAQLRTLDLGQNEIGDLGARALAESQHVANLAKLNLSGNAIGTEGAQAIGESTHLAKLEEVTLFDNPIPGLTGAWLRRKLGDRVHFEDRRRSGQRGGTDGEPLEFGVSPESVEVGLLGDRGSKVGVEVEGGGELVERLGDVAREAPVARQVVVQQGGFGVVPDGPAEGVDGLSQAMGPLVAPAEGHRDADVFGVERSGDFQWLEGVAEASQ